MRLNLLNKRDSEIVPFDSSTSQQLGNGFYFRDKKFIHYSKLHQNQSAFYRLSTNQIYFFLIAFILVMLLTIMSWHTALIAIFTVLTLIYLMDSLFNFFLIYRSFAKSSEIKVSETDRKSVV